MHLNIIFPSTEILCVLLCVQKYTVRCSFGSVTHSMSMNLVTTQSVVQMLWFLCVIFFLRHLVPTERRRGRFFPLLPCWITWQCRSCTRISPPTSSWTPHVPLTSSQMYGGGCNFDLPTPVCENYVRPFPSSGTPTRSPITIGERVLEQELPNDSQGSPIPPSSAHHPFLALCLMF